jgi:hypothetical protein
MSPNTKFNFQYINTLATILTLLPIPLNFLLFYTVPSGNTGTELLMVFLLPLVFEGFMWVGLLLKIVLYLKGYAKINLSLVTLFLGNVFLYMPVLLSGTLVGVDPEVIIIFNVAVLLLHFLTRKAAYPNWIIYSYTFILAAVIVMCYVDVWHAHSGAQKQR